MTVAATPLLTGLPATLPARHGAGHGWERCLVVLLRFSGDDGKEKMLLPFRWLAGAIKPCVGRLPWTTQSGNDDSGRIRGEGISEGHGQILPQKKKYAMQKIILAKCPQCRQPTRMSNTTTAKFVRGQQVNIEGHIARITGQTTIGKKSGETFWVVEVARLQVNEWGKKAKITGWGKAQWVRESRIEA